MSMTPRVTAPTCMHYMQPVMFMRRPNYIKTMLDQER